MNEREKEISLKNKGERSTMRRWRDFLAGFLAAALLMSMGAPSMAATARQLNASYNNIKITLDGKTITPKDANGALQVVLHTSNARAAGVLNQHLDGLHTALQNYGQEEVHVEVQRGQESQEQHFKQADPDGRGQQQNRQQQERREETPENGQEFLQKLRLGLFGTDEL
jgi:hypothetical protein